jgi:hypothetical protein
MLLTSFINENETTQLNDWLKHIKHFKRNANGELASFSLLSDLNNVPSVVDVVRNKCLRITGRCLREPVFQDFINEILPSGYVNNHTDATRDGYKHIRFNILLQKPLSGGNIIFNGKQIQQNVGDCFVLNTSYEHGVSKVNDRVSYRSIVFGFLIPNEQQLTY